jgi:hypothetical protein
MSSKGATIDIGAWLRGHGLGQYEATFRQNEIDIDILPALTESHLEKLSVPLGYRLRLLKAITDLEATERQNHHYWHHPYYWHHGHRHQPPP